MLQFQRARVQTPPANVVGDRGREQAHSLASAFYKKALLEMKETIIGPCADVRLGIFSCVSVTPHPMCGCINLIYFWAKGADLYSSKQTNKQSMNLFYFHKHTIPLVTIDRARKDDLA
jgi:hypothetical protein